MIPGMHAWGMSVGQTSSLGGTTLNGLSALHAGGWSGAHLGGVTAHGTAMGRHSQLPAAGKDHAAAAVAPRPVRRPPSRRGLEFSSSAFCPACGWLDPESWAML